MGCGASTERPEGNDSSTSTRLSAAGPSHRSGHDERDTSPAPTDHPLACANGENGGSEQLQTSGPLIRLQIPDPATVDSLTEFPARNASGTGRGQFVGRGRWDAEVIEVGHAGEGRQQSTGDSAPSSALQTSLDDLTGNRGGRRRTSVRTSSLFLNANGTSKPDEFDVASEARTPRASASPRPGALAIAEGSPVAGLVEFSNATFLDDAAAVDEDEPLAEFVSLLPPPDVVSKHSGTNTIATTSTTNSSVKCASCKADLIPRAKFCHECGKRTPSNGSVTSGTVLTVNSANSLLVSPRGVDEASQNQMSFSVSARPSPGESTGLSHPTVPHIVYHRRVKVSRGDAGRLGRGTKGCIYKAIDCSTAQPLAVKEMNLDFADKDQVDEIRTELRHLSTLRHPNVVEYLGCMVTEDKVSILMERLECGSLADLLLQFRDGIPEDAVVAMTAQLLRAVAYCHSQGITHRDIKPANILQSASGVVKLSDFGSAIVASTAEHTQVAGTPAYMPPEVLELLKHKDRSFEYGKAHDVWSIGCTVHELLTNQPPWSNLGLEPLQLVIRLKDLVFEIEKNLSPIARQFLELCLRRNMNERPTAAELLQHPFLATSVSVDI